MRARIAGGSRLLGAALALARAAVVLLLRRRLRLVGEGKVPAEAEIEEV